MVFLYVGDLRKGARRAILALSRNPEGRLLFVSRSAAEPYRRYAEAAGVADRVCFAGATNQVERIYAAADAFVHPTPYDAFGMVVSEAMACGLPVIVSKEAGASELIQHGVNGLLLTDLTNEGELAGHMRCLYENRVWAVELGAAARTRVESLSWDAVAEQTMRVYREALRRSA
jgi:UDP-glucose:(heptosyl)LPS alpha-1,3-glucosyltransferase